MGCRARQIPSPHWHYGHLLYGRDIYRPRTEVGDALRAIANIVGGVYGAPTFGAPMGDVPADDIAAHLSTAGFPRTAASWLVAVRAQRAAEVRRVAEVRVWEIPNSMIDPLALAYADACVGIASGRFVSVDLASYGERVKETSPRCRIPGVPNYVDDFSRLFERDYMGYMSRRGEEALAAILTSHSGPARPPRIFRSAE